MSEQRLLTVGCVIVLIAHRCVMVLNLHVHVFGLCSL